LVIGEGLTVRVADASAADAKRWAMFSVGLDDDDAGKLETQKIRGPTLLKFAELPEAEIEKKLVAAPYLFSGGAAVDLAAGIKQLVGSSAIGHLLF
jgi:hypothetical protein